MPNWSQSDVERATKRNPGLTVKGAELPVGEKRARGEDSKAIISSVRSELERHSRIGKVGKGKVKGEDIGRFFVRVVRVGKLLDDDNLCEKIVVDLCRYSGCLPGDAPGQTKIEVSQRTPEEGEQECTIIEVWKLNL